MNTQLITRNIFNIQHLTIIETIIRSREAFFFEIREGKHIGEKIQSMLIASFVFLSMYGVIMGLNHSLPQAIVSLVKLPILFLLTLIICTPSLHFFNILFGSKQSMSQTFALTLTAIATTSVVLFSFAPITLFFLLTTEQYNFFKLLNVIFFGLGGVFGVIFLRHGMHIVTEDEGEDGIKTRRLIFYLWMFLYAFVGSQMAWTLSPFIGMPGEPFVWLHQSGGNFYADVIGSLQSLLTGIG